MSFGSSASKWPFFLLLGLIGLSNAWSLIWEDDFSGQKLNGSRWNIANNFYHCCNNELQIYIKDEAFLSGGHLHLRSTKRTYNQYNYTSGWIDTAGKFAITYGRVEVRAKLPGGKGLWPAHWMLPNDDSCWPLEGEIDIMEYLGQVPKASGPVYGTLHWGDACSIDQSSGGRWPQNTSHIVNPTTSFHTYAVDWYEDHIDWWIDDNLYYTVPAPSYIPAHSFYLILNTAVGGDWPGSPDGTTKFPVEHIIDYVKVFSLD